MRAESGVKRRWSRVGLWLGGTYFLLTAAVFVLTAATTKPDNVGLDWIPFVELAGVWWYRIHPWLLCPGVFVNSAALYLIGWLIEKQWRSLHEERASDRSVQ